MKQAGSTESDWCCCRTWTLKHDVSSSKRPEQGLANKACTVQNRSMTQVEVKDLQNALETYQESLADLDAIRQTGQNLDDTQEVSLLNITPAREGQQLKPLFFRSTLNCWTRSPQHKMPYTHCKAHHLRRKTKKIVTHKKLKPTQKHRRMT